MDRLVFVFNIDSSSMNSFLDKLSKAISPETYECDLVKLIYGMDGMKKEWKNFIDSLKVEKEFLNRDEFLDKYDIDDNPLPAIFTQSNGDLRELVSAGEINNCETLEDLIKLLQGRL